MYNEGLLNSTELNELLDKLERQAEEQEEKELHTYFSEIDDKRKKPSDVHENIEYRENRDYLPEHAKVVLGWLDDAWNERVREYNETKAEWSRTIKIDKNGVELISWEYIPLKKQEELSLTRDEEIEQLQRAFNLSVGDSEL